MRKTNMGFLDNSGDIILDAVLTDTGRKRLAQGNGSFTISKFALADDEINYGLYNKNHSSGSAYYDLEILQTPVLEAFTNNASSVKSKLITVSNTNLLYLPVLKRFSNAGAVTSSLGMHLVACEQTSVNQLLLGSTRFLGVIDGISPSTDAFIKIDQGLDTNRIPFEQTLQADLFETQYIIEMDSRLGELTSNDGTIKRASFTDDDHISSYYLTSDTDADFIESIGNQSNTTSAIAGPRGTRLKFGIKASLELNTSDFLFEQIGLSNNISITVGGVSNDYKAIDSNIRIVGATTGYSLDIPVRFIRATT
tara:strand:- start:888 stop:1814 length:927 start_codon:yes stop_codon:yes gene_type:complete